MSKSENTLQQNLDRLHTYTKCYQTFVNGTTEFNPFDIVTAKEGYSIYGAGEPRMVLEIIPYVDRPEYPSFVGDAHDTLFGLRPDMRVAKIDHEGDVVSYWVESHSFEYWIAPVAETRIPGSYDPTDPADVKAAVLEAVSNGVEGGATSDTDIYDLVDGNIDAAMVALEDEGKIVLAPAGGWLLAPIAA